ncbi:short-chain dehydrogenase [Candidatus Berkelbacteria bacterium CG10_big_fil_rev_8_21_14_0_10_43_13]|uniref:Short-chain dehydrogenase n=1 Tax=Candidatus Berkelbacteria bacterium CG10_big_fil_rev_8_21_14_0_10_43_13 TaxID=1974514 RepID=A0A2H0W752_9BACT|nr:MAG: short-chain dehydrogenase [Candidatus Berkelbacteria bacterium CG10_big_fil_rev_8_21_14_0_10_43_13]
MLKGKSAIVTGAGQGIGEGIAKVLAKDGATVLVADLNLENAEKVAKTIVGAGGKAVAIKCDVSNKSEVDAMVEKAISEFGKLDILVNNAGIYPFKPFLEMTEEEWDKVINVNLKSSFLCTQAAALKMAEGSKIVTISSIAGFVGFEGLAHYCATKGGINASIRAIALELAKKKININAVAPGAIQTPGAASAEEVMKQTIAMIPVARMGQPEDIANAVTFLASDRADYITGQTLIVDGGWTLR